MLTKSDVRRDAFMLTGPFSIKGYDWWWHSFTAVNAQTGEEKAFFVEFYLCNPRLARQTPTFGQLPKNKENKIRPSYMMVKAGCWGKDACQIHRFFAWPEVKLQAGAPFSVQADDCSCSETQLHGHVRVSPEEVAAHPEWMSDAGEMHFDLKVDKRIAFNVGYGASSLFRKLKLFQMYWHAEGMQTRFAGTVNFNGVRYIVRPETCWGYADKNWGSGYTSPWLWLASNCMQSNLTGEMLKNCALDIGGGSPRVLGIPLKGKLLGAFVHKGNQYEFNFSKPWTGAKTRFSCEETEDSVLWHVTLENLRHVLEVEARCDKADMLLVNYEAPDGSKRHNKLWNGGTGTAQIKLYAKQGGQRTLIDDITATHVGCEYGEYDR